MIKRILLSIIAVSVCSPVFAGDREREHEERMREVREKEAFRANEAAAYHGDMEYMEKKYGWLKKEQPAKYEVLMKSRKDAERVWKSVAARIGRAKDYDEINKLKAPAHKANAVVELARLELRSAGSEISWMKSAKKSDSVAVEMIAQALIRNQKAIIEVTKKKMASDEELRQLAIKHNSLEKAMRDEYEKARNK